MWYLEQTQYNGDTDSIQYTWLVTMFVFIIIYSPDNL